MEAVFSSAFPQILVREVMLVRGPRLIDVAKSQQTIHRRKITRHHEISGSPPPRPQVRDDLQGAVEDLVRCVIVAKSVTTRGP